MRTVTILLMMITLGFSSLVWAEDVGQVEAKEGPLTATDKIVERFMALDEDETLGVSFEEYMLMVQARAEARFSLMDSNQDGEVDADEYRAFWVAQKSQYYRLKR